MVSETVFGILVPFFGTTLGAACVFFMRKQLDLLVQRALSGFAAGVMTAASVWSLLLPAIELSNGYGTWAFLPPVVGFWIGVGFLALIGGLIPQLRRKGKTAMLTLAVTLHNIPEGMAVGVAYAALLSGAEISACAAFALALGIAVQNFPEGAIISMPLRAEGKPAPLAFWYGTLSGAVEPIAAVLTLCAARLIVPAMPYFLSFAAGAMIYVVADELQPEAAQGRSGALFFALGFTVMMALDVALG